MSAKRKFFPNGCQHLCQISKDGSMLFCTIADKVFLLTLIAVYAQKYHIRITQLCIMFNHFHIQAVARTLDDLERFMAAVTWSFAFIHNKRYGQSGQVFKRAFQNVPKTHKKVFDNMIYIANNPTVKQAVPSAWDYRWNFLRYAPDAGTNHPFSEEYKPSEASDGMRTMVRKVRHRRAAGEFICYEFFESKRYLALSEKERRQLLDVIISYYNPIDYGPMLQKYGSTEQFVRVLNEVEGSEYDMNDDLEKEDYRHYDRMIEIASEEGYDMRMMRYAGIEGLKSNWTGPMMPEEMGARIIRRFKAEVGATPREISKLLKIKNYGKY